MARQERACGFGHDETDDVRTARARTRTNTNTSITLCLNTLPRTTMLTTKRHDWPNVSLPVFRASGHPIVTLAVAHRKMTEVRPRAAAQPNYHKHSDATNFSEWLAYRLAQEGSWICTACSCRRSLPEAADARAGAMRSRCSESAT